MNTNPTRAVLRRMAAEGDFAHLRIPPHDAPACGGKHRRYKAEDDTPYFAPDDTPTCPSCIAKRIAHDEWKIAGYQREIAALRQLPLAKGADSGC